MRMFRLTVRDTKLNKLRKETIRESPKIGAKPE